LWKKEYPSSFRDEIRSEDDGPRSTPAIDGNLVYTFGAEGMLSCWKLTTGEKVWSLDCQAKFMPPKGFFGIACSPLVLGEAVLLNIGGANGAGIVAFDKNNGKVLWQASRDEASYSSPVAAAIGEKQYAFFLTRKHLTALEPGNGKIIFEYPWTPRIQASVSAATPIVVGDLIFISASYGAGAALLRFHESGPDKIWSNDETLSNHYATSIYHEGFLYGFDGRQEQGCHLRCVEMKTGKVQWSKEGLGAGSLLLVKDQLLILTERGQLIRAPATPFGFKAAAQAQILPFTVRAYPAVAGDLLYARSRDKLVCLNLQGVP
jgi:outer membrane protein assembly factor BamB